MQIIPTTIASQGVGGPTHENPRALGDLSRRRFLSLSARALLAATLCTPAALIRPSIARASSGVGERALSCFNPNTHEKLQVTYWAQGRYLFPNLAEIYYFFRDHHEDKYIGISTRLIDMMNDLSGLLDCRQPFVLLSGYRTPKTNAILHRRSRNVALHSYHTTGEAADIYLPGCPLRELYKAAKYLKAGGVGYYAHKQYIHVDVGTVRYWRG